MSKTIISYKFDNATPTHSIGNHPVNFSNVKVVEGPGKTSMGKLEKALDLGRSGRGITLIEGLKTDKSRFTIQVCFKSTNSVTSRENLVESNFLPFSIYLTPAKTTSKLNIIATVGNNTHGWNGVSTQFKRQSKKSYCWKIKD